MSTRHYKQKRQNFIMLGWKCRFFITVSRLQNAFFTFLEHLRVETLREMTMRSFWKFPIKQCDWQSQNDNTWKHQTESNPQTSVLVHGNIRGTLRRQVGTLSSILQEMEHNADRNSMFVLYWPSKLPIFVWWNWHAGGYGWMSTPDQQFLGSHKHSVRRCNCLSAGVLI